jgi:hypothetical protein
MATSVLHSDTYASDHGEFAHISPTIAAASSTPALPVSVTKKRRAGAASWANNIRRPACV